MDFLPAVSSLKILTSSISFRLACTTTLSSCSFFNTLTFRWGLQMERTLDRNGFLEMFEEQEDNRSSKEKNNSVLIMNKGTFQDRKTKGDF